MSDSTPRDRIHLLTQLYRKRRDIDQEIADIELTIKLESEAIQRAREEGKRGTRRPRALCGTDSGYYHHRRQRNEDACYACKVAHSLAEKRRAEARSAS